MKDYKRALRRHKKHVFFKRRLKNWLQTCNNQQERKSVYQAALDGLVCTFLRTTSRPCNCYICTYKTYDRIPKFKWLKDVWDQIGKGDI